MPAAAISLQVLTPVYYDAVRQAIDASLDSNALSDAVIENIIYGPAAESEVLSRDPLALTYENTDPVRWAFVTRAVILITAARICPALPNLVSEALVDYHLSLKAPDLLERSATLRSMANRELSAYLNDAINLRGTVTPLPSVWLARGGGRAR
jgi:hypothetical protein